MQQLWNDPVALAMALAALLTAAAAYRNSLANGRLNRSQAASTEDQIRTSLWADVQQELERRDRRIDRLEASLDASRRYTAYLRRLLAANGIDALSFTEWHLTHATPTAQDDSE